MEYDVKVSPRALRQLTEHAQFIAEVNETAALHLINAFSEAADSLKKMPERCPAVRDDIFPVNRYRKLLFSNHFLAIYTVDTTAVYIEYVVDCKQDYQWLIK